jgi:hypothetical protein
MTDQPKFLKILTLFPVFFCKIKQIFKIKFEVIKNKLGTRWIWMKGGSSLQVFTAHIQDRYKLMKHIQFHLINLCRPYSLYYTK